MSGFAVLQVEVKHLIIRVIKRILSSFRYLLLHGVVKIFLLPVGVANVIASSSSPWKPIIYSCKQTRPISLNKKFYLKKKLFTLIVKLLIEQRHLTGSYMA